MLCIGMVYVLLFYFLSGKSFWQIIIFGKTNENENENDNKIETPFLKKLMAIWIFSILLLIFWQWESLYWSGYKNHNNEETIWIKNNWSIIFDTKWLGNFDVWIFDNNNDEIYETIKYDINFDGSVDIINIDDNWNGEIDRTIYFDYEREKYILLLLTFIYLILSFLFLKWKIGFEFNKKSLTNLSSFLILISLIPITSFWASQPDLQKMITVYPACAENPFNSDNCKWVGQDSLIFFRHMQNPDFMSMYMSYAMRMQNVKSEAELERTAKEFMNWWESWKNQTPKNPNIPAKKEEIKKEPKDKAPDAKEEIKEEHKLIQEDNDKEKNPESTNNNDPKDPKPEDRDVVDQKVNSPEDNNALTNDPADVNKVIEDLAKTEKAITDVSKKVLETLNDFTKWNIQDFVKLDQIDLNRINDLRDLKISFVWDIWKYDWVDNIVTDLSDEIGFIKNKNTELIDSFNNNKIQTDKLWKTIKALDVIWKTADAYVDVNDFYKKFNWDITKTTIATTVTTWWKWILWANPVDAVWWAISWVLNLIWEEWYATKVSEFSAWDIVKKTIENSYDTNEDEFGRMLEWELDKMSKSWDDKDSNVWTKTLKHLESTVNIFYWGWVYWVKKALNATEWAIWAFNQWVKEIWNWL